MAVKIRLQRTGMPKQASYRVVVCDARKPRDGAVLDNIGHYAPYKKDKPLDIDMDRYHGWIEKGALPTDSVKRLVKTLRKRGGATTITPPEPVAVAVEAAPAEAEAVVEEAAPEPVAEEASPEVPAADEASADAPVAEGPKAEKPPADNAPDKEAVSE